MFKVILASGNRGKVTEIKELLSILPIDLIPQHEYQVLDIPETGTTFIENAIIKARHAAKMTKLPAIADDSGLVIPALNGAPGVFSSRYAGETASDAVRINKVLSELKKTNSTDRRAFFHCVMVFMRSEFDPAPIVCQGVWLGEVQSAPSGDKGFGYDPIFRIPSHACTAAELDLTEKNRISHRGQAVAQMIQALRAFLAKPTGL